VTTVANLVGGAWIAESAGESLPDLNPSDLRDEIARVPQLSAAEAARAVRASADAAPEWRATSPVARAAVLGTAAGLLRARAGEIALDVTREMGKLIGDARAEVGKSADFLDFYAGLLRTGQGELLADVRPATFTFTRAEPLGVIVVITPWNDPVLTPARKLAPALAAGNTVVLKPAPDSPLAAAHFARALHDAGLPGGVLNMVTGDPAEIGPVLFDSPEVAAVTFTGSSATGAWLRRRLARRNIRLQTEMGGKNAAVVLPDADLSLATETIMTAAFAQTGQRCTATSRLLVSSEVRAELLERLATAMAKLRLGQATDADATVGPVVSRRQQEKVLGHLDLARTSGIPVRAVGPAPEGELAEYGCFVRPTLLEDVPLGSPLWQQEVFGPVVAVREVGSFDEAVSLVNASTYGLAASAFTRDLGMAHRFINAVDVGQVSVNLPTSGWDVHHPFGGFKDSGSPFKEQGEIGLAFYTKTKTAAVRFG
jgi:alpha-ketoglutaric semialdehyde dehydrogenase